MFDSLPKIWSICFGALRPEGTTMNIAPDTIYCGKRETVIAELGGLSHIYSGKYLVQPDGNASYDAEGADTKADMMAFIAEYKRAYPAIRVVML